MKYYIQRTAPIGSDIRHYAMYNFLLTYTECFLDILFHCLTVTAKIAHHHTICVSAILLKCTNKE